MTLDIFFDRYLLTLHAIVVALGLIVYVGVARALPQRRDPSAAIAWVVALALLPYVAAAALPDVRQPQAAACATRRALLPPVAPARRRRRRGRVALGAPPRPLDGPRAGRAATTTLRIHADGAEARRAVLERHRRRDAQTLDVCTFILARDAPRRRDRGGAAQPRPSRASGSAC